jgi:hypothetical protein
MIILFVLLIYQIKETLYIGILTQLLDSCLLDRLKWPYQKLKLNIFLKALNHIVRVHPYRSSWTAVGLYCHHFLEILQNLKMRTFKFTRFPKIFNNTVPRVFAFLRLCLANRPRHCPQQRNSKLKKNRQPKIRHCIFNFSKNANLPNAKSVANAKFHSFNMQSAACLDY